MVAKAIRYIAAFVLFLMAYGAGAFIAHLLVNFFNSDLGGWMRDFLLPYFVAVIAGPIGVAAGFTAVEKLLPSVRLRPIAWVFTLVIALIWSLALLGILMGQALEAGITMMAVQSLAALVAAFKLSSSR